MRMEDDDWDGTLDQFDYPKSWSNNSGFLMTMVRNEFKHPLKDEFSSPNTDIIKDLVRRNPEDIIAEKQKLLRQKLGLNP